MLVYPASVLFSAWLIGQFWPVPLNPSESEFRQTVLQKPVHGALDLQPDGRLVYRPGSEFRGMAVACWRHFWWTWRATGGIG